MTFAIATSSLYPIDLAAGLYVATVNQTARFKVFLNDHLRLGHLSSRRFVARAGLPFFSYEMDARGVWRQIHVPLENRSPVEWIAALNETGTTLAHALREGGRPEDARLLVDRCQKFGALAIGSMRRSGSWTDFCGLLIKEIYGEVVGRPVAIASWGKYRAGVSGDAELHTFLQSLLNQARGSSTSMAFSGGGSISVRSNQAEDDWKDFNSFTHSGDHLTLLEVGPSGDVRSSFIMKNPEDLRFRVAGPVELSLLQQFGALTHLPWYADGQYISNKNNMGSADWEAISPISVTSLARVSGQAGGGGCRLHPPGYSLLEWDHPSIMSMLARVVGVQAVSSVELSDWRDLIEHFPRVDQKASKYQGSSSAWRVYREQRLLESLRHRPEAVQKLLDDISDPTPLRYGVALLAWSTLIEAVRIWCNPESDWLPAEPTLAALRRLGWLERIDTLHVDRMVPSLEGAFNMTAQWLHERGMPDSLTESAGERFEKGLGWLRKFSARAIIAKDISGRDPRGLGLVTRSLDEIADLYYGFALFCAGALFKANILTTFLILGSEQYRQAIAETLRQRSERPVLRYRPLLWEKR